VTDQPWRTSGYSDIASAEIVDGRLRVGFANGDVVEVTDALAGQLDRASVEVDPEEALEVVVRRPNDVVLPISWTQIRSASDPAFAQHLRESDAEESRRLGSRLKALREDRGMQQAQLAELVNMPASQLSKIEAGKHDMRISTVRSLLRALDADFPDIAGDVPEMSIKRLAKRLVLAGLTAEVGMRLLNRVPRQAVYAALQRSFGWSREDVASGELLPAPLAAVVQFKIATNKPEASPLVHLAWSLARAGRAAAELPRFEGIPPEPTVVRAEIQAHNGDVTLSSLLEWTWNRGVPVLPMSGRGVFSAAVWALDAGPVIVLKEARDLAVFWLFDLAHELGHLAHGHVVDQSLVDVASPTAFGSDDKQEQEANDFALNLLLPHYGELIREVRERARGNYLAFKGAVAAVAAKHHVNAGVLGMVAAYEITEVGQAKDRWGSATNLSKEDGVGRAVTIELARQRLLLDRVDALDRSIVEAVAFGD
jgi:transcriptional regulator with XRE-family HTH domain/Zn-dependent peptidase ImmA (M78 family)